MFDRLIQTSILIPEDCLEELTRFVEARRGFVRIERGAEERDVQKSAEVDLGRDLRKLREASGMTQKDLAEKLGVPQGHISRYESGMRSVPKSMLPELEGLLSSVREEPEQNDLTLSNEGDHSMSTSSVSSHKLSYTCPRNLFYAYPNVREHTQKGGNFEVNGMLAPSVGATPYLINKLLVEKHPGYDELCELIRESGRCEHPDVFVAAHLRNMAYYSSRGIAEQWGVIDVLKKNSWEDLPPCFVALIDGREVEIRVYEKFDKERNSLAALKLLKKAEKIRCPLYEALVELAQR